MMRLPTKNRVTFPYGATSSPYSKSNPHAGTDNSFQLNPYVYAPEKGTVTQAGSMGTCGTGVNLTGGGGRKYRFCHMDKLYVKSGQKIKEGQKIGRIGATGYAFGKHLHWVMWVNGKRVNGQTYVSKTISKENKAMDKLKAQIKKLESDLKKMTKNKNIWRKRTEEKNKIIAELNKTLKTWKNKPPEVVEVEKIIENEVVKEIEVERFPSWIPDVVKSLLEKIFKKG